MEKVNFPNTIEVINIDKDTNQLRLSIKDIDYKKDGAKKRI